MLNKKLFKLFPHNYKKRTNKEEQFCFGEPSIYHALIIIFLEFFSWGLLTSPMINALNDTFPDHTFLMNGIIQGIKGLLSFFSAPMIGALSDVWGRKSFLFLTVFFTCSPIPLMRISPWWFFALISISGILSVTFSIVFAYVSDITTEENRAISYGLVSATFAASLITSPAIGAYLHKVKGETYVVTVASLVALVDVLFIIFVVPESLSYRASNIASIPARTKNLISSSPGTDLFEPVGFGIHSAPLISWQNADPLLHIRRIGKDRTIMILCITIFFSYLPESGQYSSFFVYLKLIMNFSGEEVASFIAFVGILSVIAQTFILNFLMRFLGGKTTILIGLTFEIFQLAWYGFASKMWMMWSAGALASLSSITYPAISSYISTQTDPDKQGLVQGLITGIRGLCNGIGPALFGFIFYMFHVDLDNHKRTTLMLDDLPNNFNHTGIPIPQSFYADYRERILPGPPYVFGAFLVMMAFLLALLIPENVNKGTVNHSPKIYQTNPQLSYRYQTETQPFIS
ncbi:unnamed protein product [Gordionus sp. m RMFG-2023]|uniref:hippocampus abundant transcript 1 protein-like n=1 Tax=Gordionus sp. m RMFG-2023 TaxID=3053472 RepID=UPI0030DF4B0E